MCDCESLCGKTECEKNKMLSGVWHKEARLNQCTAALKPWLGSNNTVCFLSQLSFRWERQERLIEEDRPLDAQGIHRVKNVYWWSERDERIKEKMMKRERWWNGWRQRNREGEIEVKEGKTTYGRREMQWMEEMDGEREIVTDGKTGGRRGRLWDGKRESQVEGERETDRGRDREMEGVRGK